MIKTVALIGFQGRMLQHGPSRARPYLRPLKKKGFKEERVTTIGLYDIGTSTTLESNKSLLIYAGFSASNGGHFPVYSTTFLPFFERKFDAVPPHLTVVSAPSLGEAFACL